MTTLSAPIVVDHAEKSATRVAAWTAAALVFTGAAIGIAGAASTHRKG